MRYKLSKYQGAGNDLIIIDDRPARFPQSKELIQKLCHRNYGIGSDGLILVREDPLADFRMVFFNPDGGEVSMCGNGIRCVVEFLRKTGIQKETYQIATAKKIYSCKIEGEKIHVNMGAPAILHWDYPVEVEGAHWRCYVVDSGVPHAVIFTEDLQKQDVKGLGRAIRNHPCFSPEGVNVSFIELSSPESIHIRTYERGVEAETLACGTAAVASAFIARRLGLVSSKIEVLPVSGEKIAICFLTGHEKEEVEMIGKASFVYHAWIDMDEDGFIKG